MRLQKNHNKNTQNVIMVLTALMWTFVLNSQNICPVASSAWCDAIGKRLKTGRRSVTPKNDAYLTYYKNFVNVTIYHHLAQKLKIFLK
jgi:hypothetical protein